MKQFRPVTSRIRSKILKGSFEDAVVERIELDPGRVWDAKPLLIPTGELARIKGHHRDADVALNCSLIHCQAVRQGPTVAYRVTDVLIANGQVMGPSWVRNIRRQRRRLIAPDICGELEFAGLSSTTPSEQYFGHWLRDQLSTELLVSDWGMPSVSLPNNNRPSEEEFRKLTGLSAVQSHSIVVNNLWMYDDFEITDHRISRIKRLRQRIRAQGNGEARSVFIVRGHRAIGRELVNEGEIVRHLSQLGFFVIDCATAPVSQIIDVLKNAETVIGAEGSAFANALICAPPTARIITLQSPRHINLIYRIYCEALGMRFGMVIGEACTNGGFKIAVDRLVAFIEDLPELEKRTAI